MGRRELLSWAETKKALGTKKKSFDKNNEKKLVPASINFGRKE
jgi:hypothetical protein